MNIDILNKFTTHLRNTLVKAADYAQEWGHPDISPEHLIYSLLQQKGSIGLEILNKAGLDQERIKEFIIHHHAVLPPSIDREEVTPLFADTARQAVTKAGVVAQNYRHTYIGTEHLLFSLIESGDKGLQHLFDDEHVSLPELRQHLLMVLKSTSKFPDLTEIFDNTKQRTGTGTGANDTSQANQSKTPSLDFFCTDLTSESLQRKIDPVIGREKEIERLIHILCRRTKNNPVLIGDPGVGKTAIVEGLAKRVLAGDVPDALMNKRMLALDLGLVVAGTMYRGEFEGRFKQILEEIKSDPNVVLFIDELHTIIGTGGAAGALDAANILKPALARGDVRCIGATTMDEYRKHIESDAALERRFQPIIVDQATVEETKQILAGVKKNYETFHHVLITDEAIDAAAELSARYIQDKFLPDKAIDLIDEAAAKRKVATQKDIYSKDIQSLQKEINKLEDKKKAAVAKEEFHKALRLKKQQELLEQKIDSLQAKQAAVSNIPLGRITRADVADVISRLTRIPINDLIVEEKSRLLGLEKTLTKRIVGQDEAVSSVASYIRRAKAGLSNPNRPLGSFIFLGPSGVGKTELANVVAREVFGSDNALIRIDMSEFAESFQASKLIGAPAGYVGYKDGGKLTETVRRKPYSVVLFDEIEKAHPEIFNLFLQIFEDGQITDAAGKVINFRNTIIVMTSNIGLSDLQSLAHIGFDDGASDLNTDMKARYANIRERVLDELKKQFRPEFLNRIDATIVFKPLSMADVKRIVDIQLGDLNQRLEKQNLAVAANTKAISHIATKGFSPDKGARAIRQVIQDEVENPLADMLLRGQITEGTVKLGVDHGHLTLTV